MMERQRPPSPVSVEDLLRLKRAERPAPEFWTEFEAQLRYKQLVAIVDKRPWWRRVSLRNVGKLAIPFGATAAIALTVFTVRQPQPGAAPQAGESAPLATTHESVSPVAATPSSGAVLVHRTEVAAEAHERIADAEVSPEPVAKAATQVATAAVMQETDSPASSGAPEYSLAQVILGLEGSTESDARPQFEVESGFLSALQVGDFQSVALERREIAPAQPAATVSQDPRRARLLASLSEVDESAHMESNPRVARSRERITRRLTEQALYDSISRLGLNGDSVSIRF